MNKDLIRIHHLLCIPLFAGEGYSSAFCENMSRVIRELNARPAQKLKAVCRADMICSGCPNLTKESDCKDDDSKVDEKDRRLAEKLGIHPESQYTYQELLEIAKTNLTKEIFLESCGNCRWFLQGLCSYEEWGRNLKL